jgi:hypothetical protein
LTFSLTPTKPAPAQKKPAAAGLLAGSDFELESLQAQVHVKLRLADGQSADADQLIAKSTPEGMTAVFLGQPAATLTDGHNTITGPNIKVTYDAQHLQVIGPGTVHFAAADSSDEPAQPVRISWQSGMSLDGRANRAEMTGGVSITSDASDGSKQIASSDRLTAELADATEPTTAPSDSPLGRKTLRAVALTGDAQLQSVLSGDDPAEIRRMHLFASDIRYDVPSRRAEAPGNGRLLMQDTRRRPNDAVASAEGGANQQLLSGFRGATAFQWDRGLVLDQSTNQMTMSGSVLIVHQDDANAAQSFRLQANQVVAGFLSDNPPATRPTGELAAMGPSNMRLKSLSADGDIMLSLGQIQLEAQTATYDAISELLTARGGDNRPVELFNDQGISRGSFQEIVWNARTEQIERMRQVQAQVRR